MPSLVSSLVFVFLCEMVPVPRVCVSAKRRETQTIVLYSEHFGNCSSLYVLLLFLFRLLLVLLCCFELLIMCAVDVIEIENCYLDKQAKTNTKREHKRERERKTLGRNFRLLLAFCFFFPCFICHLVFKLVTMARERERAGCLCVGRKTLANL